MLFTVPSRYWFTIGRLAVFSLGGWSPPLPTRIPRVRRYSRSDHHGPARRRLRGSHPLRSRPFQRRSAHGCATARGLPPPPPMSSNPRTAAPAGSYAAPVWAPPRSLAATTGILSVPRGTEMFQFPRCPSACSRGCPGSPCAGRVAPFGDPRITGCQRLPGAFRRVAASFLGRRRQGIHRAPIICTVSPPARASPRPPRPPRAAGPRATAATPRATRAVGRCVRVSVCMWLFVARGHRHEPPSHRSRFGRTGSRHASHRPAAATTLSGSRVPHCQGARPGSNPTAPRARLEPRPDHEPQRIPRLAAVRPRWSRGDSNPGPPPCKGGALPAKLRPPRATPPGAPPARGAPVGAPGLEPGTSALSGPRSNHLSYAPRPAAAADAHAAVALPAWPGRGSDAAQDGARGPGSEPTAACDPDSRTLARRRPPRPRCAPAGLDRRRQGRPGAPVPTAAGSSPGT